MHENTRHRSAIETFSVCNASSAGLWICQVDTLLGQEEHSILKQSALIRGAQQTAAEP